MLGINTFKKLQNHIQKLVRLLWMNPMSSASNVFNGCIWKKPKNFWILGWSVNSTQTRQQRDCDLTIILLKLHTQETAK